MSDSLTLLIGMLTMRDDSCIASMNILTDGYTDPIYDEDTKHLFEQWTFDRDLNRATVGTRRAEGVYFKTGLMEIPHAF